ncbi:MAG: beta-lactamase family protein [Acidobacteria bacterium]|nr:beta-lactamase family protein [Acidobacteriota bacterium]
MPSGPRAHAVLQEFVERHARDGHWPGGAYAVGPPAGEPAWCGCGGMLALEPAREPARDDALFDLASVTKGIGTASVALRLSERGLVDLDQPLATVLPELEGYAGRTPTLDDLMHHRAGLPAWAPLYRIAARPADAVAALAALEPAAPAGARAVYSCLSAIAAGVALERLSGLGLRELLRREVAIPLGIAEGDLGFSPLASGQRSRTAPTERGRAREAQLAGLPPAPADEPLRGTVHDNNSAFLGGASGNAGLFGTARAVFRVASALVTGGLLGADSRARLRAVGARSDDEARTFGFQSGSAATAPAGAFGPASFGHVGFTGTSVWLSPDPAWIAVLLTNRVHPRWVEAPMQTWRREFHDLAWTLRGESP